jgi:hypothetical protein
MGVSLDPRKAHSAHKYGDLTIVLSWMNDKRAMFIIPNVRTKAPWFIIPEEAAFEWSDQDTENLVYLPTRAYKACEVLGIEPSKPNVFRIISMVNNRMQDFLRMPSAQPPEKIAGTFGQMTLKEDGKIVSQAPITFEQEGASYG